MPKVLKKIPTAVVLAVAVPAAAAALDWAGKKQRARHPEQTKNTVADWLEKGSQALRAVR